MPIDPRSYVSTSFFLELDGVKAGFVRAVEGGEAIGEVVSAPMPPGHFVAKHIGNVRYAEITLQVEPAMPRPVYEWIAASWNGQVRRMKGRIQTCNHRLEVTSELEFHEALLTEVTFPACDGGSKDPAYLTLRIAPEYTRLVRGSGKRVVGELGKADQKPWLPSNFRLEIPGLDCTRVSRIEALTVKASVAPEGPGDARDQGRPPARLDFPDLRVSLSERTVETWREWAEDFLVRGNNGQASEKSGALVLLSGNRKDELARIELHNLGIYRLAPARAEASGDQLRRVVAEMYCERMELRQDPSARTLAAVAMPVPG